MIDYQGALGANEKLSLSLADAIHSYLEEEQ